MPCFPAACAAPTGPPYETLNAKTHKPCLLTPETPSLNPRTLPFPPPHPIGALPARGLDPALAGERGIPEAAAARGGVLLAGRRSQASVSCPACGLTLTPRPTAWGVRVEGGPGGAQALPSEVTLCCSRKVFYFLGKCRFVPAECTFRLSFPLRATTTLLQ